MYAYEQVRKYREAVLSGNLAAVLELFEPAATVSDPIAGHGSAQEFHTCLFRKRRRAIARLRNVLDGLDKNVIGLQFSYTWVLDDGNTLTAEGVTLFELAPETGRFTKLTLIYDASDLRRHLPRADFEGLALN
ncbi:MAG TPA: nuclear transport factor 2 family protein [Noviherbaspirillum sp.]|nr:nuclear transport factor 2 family protein [Noviherbaspirillum sp.]